MTCEDCYYLSTVIDIDRGLQPFCYKDCKQMTEEAAAQPHNCYVSEEDLTAVGHA